MTTHSDPTVKHDALYLFEAYGSNPNGDPDNAGKPAPTSTPDTAWSPT